MANPISVPGTVVPSGSLISPGGAQGVQGLQGTTALATAAQNGLLRQVSGNTTDFVDGTNNSQPLQPVIWSVRLRSWNSVGNPTFEVDQRNCNNSVSYGVGNVSGLVCDRWAAAKVLATGTGFVTSQIPGPIFNVPGTSFGITRARLIYQTNVAQGTLGVGEYIIMYTLVEGPQFRELINDVHSLQLLVSCDISPLKFSVSIRDVPATKSIVYLCTYTGGLQLITIPNIPVFPTGNFTTAPGAAAYQISVCLACGSTFIAPAAGSWQAGSFMGAPGMDNFAANASKNFFLNFIQHEPGALCTTPIDCPFGQNLDGDMGCLRYYQKSYNYADKAGTVTSNGSLFITGPAGQSALGGIVFLKPMAKQPTVVGYSNTSGAVNTIRDVTAGADKTASPWGVGEKNFQGWSVTAPNASTYFAQFHYTADTGW
jgi:hypothetical protein